MKNKQFSIEDSKSGLCLRTELVEILNIQKIGNFLSLKFPGKLGGNSR